MTPAPLYGPKQSRFARYLERQERRRPDPVARELRRKALTGLRGRVIEVGCGDGRSFEHYPPDVERVLAVEPDPTARAAAMEEARTAAIAIDVVDGVAEALPAGNGAFDAAVVMGLLCSVPDPAAALLELRRVLVPGGELRFWEHVRSKNRVFQGAPAFVRRSLLDACTGRVPNDARHGISNQSGWVSDRDARPSISFVVFRDDHCCAEHHRRSTRPGR